MPFFGNKTEWMFGKTPPEAIVTVPNNLDNSSSFRMASWMCLGTILDFLLSLEAFPASSRTSAAKYSNTAAKYTGAPAPTRVANLPTLRYLYQREKSLKVSACNFKFLFEERTIPTFPIHPHRALVIIIE